MLHTLKPDAEKTIAELAAGNPGALVALSQTYREMGENDFSTLVHHLRQLKFQGAEIYLCWNDFAGRNIPKFFEGVRSKNPQMVSIVNKEMKRG